VRLRQIALVAEDLEAAADSLGDVLGLGAPFPDPGVGEFGLANAVFPVGDTFLEVVSPVRDGTTARRLIERRGGDGGYMVIVQSQSPAEDRARVERLGVRIVWSIDLPDAGAIHLHPRDVGGAILSLDRMDPVESWKWGGPNWEANVETGRCAEIVGAEVQAEDPAAMAARWAEVSGSTVREESAGVHLLEFDEGGFVRFHGDRDGRGEGVSGLVIRPSAGGEDAIRSAALKRGAVRSDGDVELVGIRISFAAS